MLAPAAAALPQAALCDARLLCHAHESEELSGAPTSRNAERMRKETNTTDGRTDEGTRHTTHDTPRRQSRRERTLPALTLARVVDGHEQRVPRRVAAILERARDSNLTSRNPLTSHCQLALPPHVHPPVIGLMATTRAYSRGRRAVVVVSALLALACCLPLVVCSESSALPAAASASPSSRFRARHSALREEDSTQTVSAPTIDSLTDGSSPRVLASGFLGTEFSTGVDVAILVGCVLGFALLVGGCGCICSAIRHKPRPRLDRTLADVDNTKTTMMQKKGSEKVPTGADRFEPAYVVAPATAPVTPTNQDVASTRQFDSMRAYPSIGAPPSESRAALPRRASSSYAPPPSTAPGAASGGHPSGQQKSLGSLYSSFAGVPDVAPGERDEHGEIVPRTLATWTRESN